MKAKTIILMLFIVISMNITIPSVEANSAIANKATVPTNGKSKSSMPNETSNAKPSAYSVDGRTSASVLAAQRSHTVPGKQERNFAIFTGIVVILAIVLFSNTQLK